MNPPIPPPSAGDLQRDATSDYDYATDYGVAWHSRARTIAECWIRRAVAAERRADDLDSRLADAEAELQNHPTTEEYKIALSERNRFAADLAVARKRIVELEAERVLLTNELHQAQWTTEFMHNCLTKPDRGQNRGGYAYEHPEQTLQCLERWRKLAPPPTLCHHSRFHETCPACASTYEWRLKVLAARERIVELEAALERQIPGSALVPDAIGRDKPFHKPECTCDRCRAWLARAGRGGEGTT